MSAADESRDGINFEKIDTHRTFEMVCEKIREKLASGALKPGDKLPAERKMAEQFGVSRSAIREALRSLEIGGLLKLQKGVKGGAFVLAGSSEGLAQILKDLVHLDAMSVRDLTEARALLLGMVARLAAERATEADIAALSANLEKTRAVIAAGRADQRVMCAFEFYHLLAASTGNRAVVYLVDSQTSVVQAYMHLRTWNMAPEDLFRSRVALIQHIRDRNPDAAARELEAHLEKVGALLWANWSTP